MKHPVEQNQFDFLSSHPLIRDMSEYKDIFQAITTGNAADPACGGHDFDQRCGASRQAAVPDPAASVSTNKDKEVA